MFGIMRAIEFDETGTSEPVIPKIGVPFVVRKVEISRVADPLLLSFLSEDEAQEAYFLQSLDGIVLSPLMTGPGIALLVYARTHTDCVQ